MCQVCSNWASGSGGEDFEILWKKNYYFVIISPWRWAWPFIWTNLNSLHLRMLYAKFGWNEPRGSWEDFKIFLHNFAFSLLFPLGERPGPPFFQTWIRSTQECFVPSLVKIGPVVLEKKLKMWKVYRHTDRQTDRWQTTGNQKSLLKLSAQVS